MSLPRDKIGLWIKRHALSLNGSVQGIRLGLLSHGCKKGSVPASGGNSRKHATYQHDQNHKGENRTKGYEHIRNGHTRPQAGPAKREQEAESFRKKNSPALRSSASLVYSTISYPK